MRRYIALACAATAAALALGGCSQKQAASKPTPASTPNAFTTPTPVVFKFNDVAVVTTGQTLLRLGFDIRNNSRDPVQCDQSLFHLQLADGSTIEVDASAENSCAPDPIDVHGTAKATLYFDMAAGYTGPITLLLDSNQNVLIGRGRTTIQ